MIPRMALRYLFHRVLSWTISPILRTTVYFTDAIHITVLSTCNLMQDLIEDSSRNSNYDAPLLEVIAHNHNPDFCSRDYNACVSTCTQTEKPSISSVQSKEASNTEIVIHNMNSSKKVIIIQKDLSKEKKRRVQCGNCKSGIKYRSLKKEEKILQKSSTERSSVKNRCSSFSSNMSLENDVSDAKIIEYSQNISLPKSVHEGNPSLTFTSKKNDLDLANKSRISNYSKPEESKVIQSPVTQTNEEDAGTHQQKTSSPVEQFVEQAWVNHWNAFAKNQAKNENFNNFSDLYHAAENVDKYNTDAFESTFVLDKRVKRRLSLPSKFNRSNEVTVDFQLYQDKIFEEVGNSSNSGKKITDLKFPIPLESCLVNRRSDETNDSKGGMFSSSSYESLPVSEHFRTVLGKSSLFSITKSSTDDVSSNFSSVDELVEAFQNVTDELSVSKTLQKKISSIYFLSNGANNAEKLSLREPGQKSSDFSLINESEHNYCAKSTCEMQIDNLGAKIVPDTLLKGLVSAVPSTKIGSTEEKIDEVQTYQILSSDSAISSPDSSSIHEAVETMLNEIVSNLH